MESNLAADARDDGDEKGAGGLSPLSALVIALSLVVVGIGLWAATRGDEIAVWETTTRVPAHHILAESDVKLVVRRTKGVFVKQAIGRMTKRALREGAPVKQDDLGPDVKRQLGRDPVVVGIRATPEDAVAGSLTAGDLVEIVGNGTQRATPVEGLVMAISTPPGSGRHSYVVALAVRRHDARRQNWFRAGDIRLVRDLVPAP